jgi:glycosyltransferase involved in cell wall biosynthesis
MIRILEFADVINRYDFIDTIITHADHERFEVSVCVRTEDSKIAPPEFPSKTKYRVLPGNSRKDALKTAWKLAGLLREWEIDILHTHHYEQAIVGWLATRIFRKTKLVIGRHYSDSIYRNPNPLKRKALLAIEQRINHDCERIIVPSKMIFDILVHKQGIAPEKIDIIHYGFVKEKYKTPNDDEIENIKREFGLDNKLVVANFSRYHEEKGHKYLILAAKELKKKYDNFVILCVGEGPERTNLEQQIKDLNLQDKLILTGWRSDSMTIMAASDMVVQSTLQEAFSQVMCEAMWMGKPLIMTNVSGAEDVITNGENGIIIPKAEPGAIANAISKLIESPELSNRISSRARHYVENNLTIEKQIRKYEQSFERAFRG